MKKACLLVMFLSLAAAVHALQEHEHRISTVQFKVPEGFDGKQEDRFYTSEEYGSSIMIRDYHIPMEQLVKDLTSKDELMRQRMTLISQEEVVAGESRGILIHVNQKFNELDLYKWMLVLGDGSDSVLITAIYHAENKEALQDSLKESLLTAKRHIEVNE